MAIPLLGRRLVAAYHVPNFNIHILTVPYLSDLVDITFLETSNRSTGASCSNQEQRHRIQGSHQGRTVPHVSSRSTKTKSFKASKSEDVSEAKSRHEMVSHISTVRYIALVQKYKRLIAYFSRHVWKPRKREDQYCQSNKSANRPIQEVHADISGKLRTPSLNGEAYIAHFI